MHKKKLSIAPAWIFRTDEGDLFEPVLFRLLENIRESGKLTSAAAAAGISYRHAWNLLNRGADTFGLPMVLMRKGHGTQLSPLGEKLLWADQRVKARLGPQIDSMASEFNDQIQQLLAGQHPVLRLHASHGYAVALLPEFSDQVEINLQYRNPEEALTALNRGECDLASFHFPTCPERAREILHYYRHQLVGDQFRLIRFVTRREGLMMRKDAPVKVSSLPELASSGLRFIGRDRHSGTRVLFNLLLRQAGLAEDSINRSPQQEFTHTAVAAFVAAGMADVGFGVEAAASQFNLDFVEMAREHYLLLCHKDRMDQSNLNHLLNLMRSQPFIDRIHHLPGYEPDAPGTVTTFEQLLAGVD
ncbi:substrate-binding domain-containing protein [Marinobacter subterrani]|uniref:Periplasmic molybdate-binding protein/domain n=1 Tax=Marinobacter subterrani TaxID=1658765 RepID=A0A0J7J438_9GAMM|nr:substrate-binding domain-containing protein [Marinobacter subterrani]KMQ72972.1 Periplasmic molybdate-binding protein/domain [Marinobacter subterrani]